MGPERLSTGTAVAAMSQAGERLTSGLPSDLLREKEPGLGGRGGGVSEAEAGGGV